MKGIKLLKKNASMTMVKSFHVLKKLLLKQRSKKKPNKKLYKKNKDKNKAICGSVNLTILVENLVLNTIGIVQQDSLNFGLTTLIS